MRLPALLVIAAIGSASAQEPDRLPSSDNLPAVYGVLVLPRTQAPHPAVVILHGSFGWRPIYAQIAQTLADSGFVALAINYFAETGRDSTKSQRLQMHPQWLAAIRHAVEYLRRQPFVRPDRIGLIGYSRGAFLAVSVASTTPGVKAVVDYFGGIDTSTVPLEDQIRNFPPLLILHGAADTVVPVTRAYQLQQAVVSHGGEVEMHIYPGMNHAFNARFSPGYSDSAAADSEARTIVFLKRRLQQE